MRKFTPGFGISVKYINDSEKIERLKALTDIKTLEAINQFANDNSLNLNDITIKEGEWEQGLPYAEAPDIIPFTKTFIVEVE